MPLGSSTEWKRRAAKCQPNEVTFLAVLSACSHGGLVREGVGCFEMMVCEYGFAPMDEHYRSFGSCRVVGGSTHAD